MKLTRVWHEKQVSHIRQEKNIFEIDLNVPSDALLHTTKRFDYNTEYGRLLEITIDRRAKDLVLLHYKRLYGIQKGWI